LTITITRIVPSDQSADRMASRETGVTRRQLQRDIAIASLTEIAPVVSVKAGKLIADSRGWAAKSG
jgi:hypothetical protein